MSNDDLNQTISVIGAPEHHGPSVARLTRDRIRELINEFLESPEGELDHLRKAARDLEVLPLLETDNERWFGITPDGEVVSFGPAAPHDLVEEEDLWIRAATLAKTLSRYPELDPLVPPPPLSCQTCARCGGSGFIVRGGHEVFCICEGLGWLPSVEDKIEMREHRKRG